MGRVRFTARDIYDIHWMGIDTGKTLSQIATHFNAGTGTITFVKRNVKKYWDSTKHATKPYRIAIKLIKEEEARRVQVVEEAKAVKDDIEIDRTIAEAVNHPTPETNHTNGYSLNINTSTKADKPEHLRKLEYAFDMFQLAIAEYVKIEFNTKNAAFLKEYAELKSLMEDAKGTALIEKLQENFHISA